MTPADPTTPAPTADAATGTPDAPSPTPGSPASALTAPRPLRDRLADAIVYLAVPLMVLALLDPLEGGVVIAVLAVPVAVVAFMRHSRARWVIVTGLVLFAAAFAYMSVAGRVAAVLQNASLIPWMAAVLVTVAGGVWLLRDVLAGRHPRAATIVPALLAVVAIAFTARVILLLGQYRPWDVAMVERAAIDGPGVRLALELEDRAIPPNEGYWGAAVLENTGTEPVTLPPGTLLNIVMRDPTGTMAWDGAQGYYGPVPRVLPWSRDVVVAPGERTRRPWTLLCTVPGTYQVTAEVQGGLFDGLATEPVAVVCAQQP